MIRGFSRSGSGEIIMRRLIKSMTKRAINSKWSLACALIIIVPAWMHGLSVTACGQERLASTQTGAFQSRQTDNPQTAAQRYFTDVELVNQDGEKMRLYSDLL